VTINGTRSGCSTKWRSQPISPYEWIYEDKAVGIDLAEFHKGNSSIRKNDMGHEGPRSTPPNFRSGTITIFNQYTVGYSLINEIYIMAVSHVRDNPFDTLPWINKVKKILVTVCKGTEINAARLMKSWGEIFFALERTMSGEDGTEILSQKLADVSPFTFTNNKGSEITSISDKGWKDLSKFEEDNKRLETFTKLEFKVPESSFNVEEREHEQFQFSFKIMENSGHVQLTRKQSYTLQEMFQKPPLEHVGDQSKENDSLGDFLKSTFS